MAAPNIITATSIIGKTHAESITASPLVILQNLSNSNEVLRVNVLYVVNTSVNTTTFTVDLYRNGVSYKIVYNLAVNQGSSVVAIAKDSSLYLEEGDDLRISASQSGVLQFVVSYEIMS